MENNNQYWQAMTKPLPYGCVEKQENVPSILEFNKILDRVSHEDHIGHLFVGFLITKRTEISLLRQS